jgi:hypothetical protein
MTDTVAYANVTTTEAHVQQLAQPSDSAQWEGGLSLFGLKQWQSEAIKGVYKVRALKPDWDGEGGQPPSSDVGRTALAIISYLSSEDLPPPFVAPTPQGGISLEWVAKDRELELELLPELKLLFLKTQSDEPIEEGQTDILQLTNLFKWLQNDVDTTMQRNVYTAILIPR